MSRKSFVSVLAIAVTGLAIGGCENGQFKCPFGAAGPKVAETSGKAAAPVADDAAAAKFLAEYKGTPFTDEKVKGVQKIPGAIYPAYFDKGGEGVAYHDVSKNNDGSNGLNKGGNKYVDQFRRDESVDISYTKDFADKWEGQKAFPPMDELYLGWTDPSEWVNVTLDVAESGVYTVDLLYTSNKGGEISFSVNGKKVADGLKIETTYDAKDTTGWRQWHHWNVAKNLAEIKLAKGKNVLTVHIDKEGNMNLLTLDFKKK
jgi:hypothetical protein